MTKPKILVTNDDSVDAPGIRKLITIMRKLGEVIVVAPDKPQSGMGHAITVATPLRLKKICVEENYQEYSCNGTPVDCVKIAEKAILKGKPDLKFSFFILLITETSEKELGVRTLFERMTVANMSRHKGVRGT